MRRALRVLMVMPTPFFVDGGGCMRVLEEARALQQAGHSVAICTYNAGRDLAELDIHRVTGCLPCYGPDELAPTVRKVLLKTALDVGLLAGAARVARRIRPDCIHAHLDDGAGIGLVVSRLLRLPMVYDYQGSHTAALVDDGALRPASLVARLRADLERRVARRCGMILVSAPQSVEYLVRSVGVGRERVRVVLDRVNVEHFRPGGDGARPREALGIPADAHVVVYLGMLRRSSGIETLLTAAKIVAGRRPDVHFLVMGYPNVEYYRSRAADDGFERRVTFTGAIDYFEAPRYLAVGDVAVAPKPHGQGGANAKVLTYMGMGLPVVAFEDALNRTMLGEHGVYAAPGDAGSLAERIAELLDAPGRRQRLGRALRERAVAHFSWSHCARELEDAYQAAGVR